MVLFPVLIFVVELVFSDAASIPESNKINTFYDALEKKCPLVKDFPDYKTQKLFEKCTDWAKINATENLTQDTENDVLCLLYYDSLSLFCSEILKVVPEQRPSNISLYFTPTLAEYKAEVICKNLSLFPPGKKFEHNVTQWLKTEAQCLKVCSTYAGSPEIECSLAHYFANLYITTPAAKKAVPEAGKAQTDEKKSPVETEQHESAPVKTDTKPENENQDHQSVVQPENTLNVALGAQPANTGNLPPNDASKGVDAPGKSVPEVVQTSEKDKSPVQTAAKPSSDQQSPTSTNGKGSTTQAVVANEGGKGAVDETKPDAVPANKGVLDGETVKHPDVSADGNLAEPEMEIESPSMQQVEPDLENPDDGPPLDVDDDDEEQQYKKEELEAYKEEMKEKQTAENESPKVENEDKKGEPKPEVKKENEAVVMLPDNIPISSANSTDIDGESYFFSYFMAICVLFVLGYVGYHNRQKVMALMVEGKRGKRQFRGRRPNSANYHKLDSNLEEAISSSCTKNSSHVIY